MIITILQFYRMKNLLIIFATLLLIVSCNSKKKVAETLTLPKDISEKPEGDITDYDREILRTHLSEIEQLAQSEFCENTDDWTYAPIGSKPCGGPSSYIAFHKNVENQIMPKITQFNEMSAAFNKKHGLVSDCMMVPEPAGIVCENGTAKLIRGNSVQALESAE